MRRLLVVPVLAVALATGCAGADDPTLPVPTVTSSAPSASPTAARPSASPVLSKDFGFLTGVDHPTAPVRLRWDRATFLTGDAANEAAAAHHDETPVPNDYYIVNDNPKIRVVTLASTVAVFGSIALNDDAGHPGVDPAPRTVAELLHFLKRTQSAGIPFNLRLDAKGLVIRIEEQYVP